MTRFLTWIALGAWGSVAFAGAFWASFPSKAVTDRLAYEVSSRSDGAWELQVGSVAPWWYGLSASQVVVSSVDRISNDATPKPVFFADTAGIRVSPWSLLRLSPAPLLMGYIGMDSATLDFALRGATRDGAFAVRSVKLDASNLSVVDLLGLLGMGGDGGTTATGGVDLSVDLQMPNGLGKSDGEISITGNQIQIEKVTSTLIGWNQMEVNTPIDELNLHLAVEGGEATITDGVLSSPLVEAKLTGEVSLDDNVARSKVAMGAVVKLGEWESTPLENFRNIVEGAMRSARFADGSFHYKVAGQLGHLSYSDFRPEHEGGSRSSLLRPVPTSTGATPTSLSSASQPPPPPTPQPDPNAGAPNLEPEPVDDPNADLPPENADEAPTDEVPLHDEEPAPPEN